MMRSRLTVAAVVAALAVPAAVRAQQEVRSAQAASLSGEIEIYNLSGFVTLHRGTGSDVTVRPTARGADADRLRFSVDRSDAGSTFRVQIPDDVDEVAAPEGRGRSSWGRTNVRVRSDGTFGGDRGGRGREVTVGRDGLRAWAELDVTVPANARVKVHLVVGEVRAEGVDGAIVVDTWSANVTASDVAGTWLFDTGSGDVEVRGARGSLRIDTGSGNGIVTGMRGDVLDIDTGSGDVEVSDAQVDRCNFDTGSGDVRATGLTASRCAGDTGSGSVQLDYTGGTIDDLRIDTGSGDVTLTLPPNASVAVDIEVASGDIDIRREGGVLQRRSRNEMTLRFGEGRGRVSIDTGSGGVTIR